MNILALDTSAAVLSVALATGTDVWYFEVDGGLRHGELLMDVVDHLLGSAGLEPTDLELAACMKGPGSFTGLRIAFAAAKGLALSLGIPMVSAPTLDCMAASQAAWPGIVLPAMDAKKGRFFTALYRGGLREGAYRDASPEEIAEALSASAVRDDPVMITGPAAEMVLERLKPLFDGSLDQSRFFVDPLGKRGKARELLDIVKKMDIVEATQEVFSGPLYLRKSDAELTFKAK
ncbi:tRNA (adenosine(37)-N6)-threonylcarbamoyltransferase complex dimerization subunit type 1 TsaB [Treponema primitia]|uniref:tRNA (adenosine(37)-N6)-threonylcarbamoyltransferase complex dimerization subunit type 1 TsaB n=1 Tax=Treponema primitia TaxID=88058 RepID=UPI000255574E|nr:tRNA (adenosine(37)-N6)-threonylcarbamoyltransferase complex dimerization subunit type 1 TsaB [Treponema primitia]